MSISLKETRELAEKLIAKHLNTESAVYSYVYNSLKLAPTVKGWTFEFSKKKALGSCHWINRVITINYEWVRTGKATRAEVLDTILHEIAHALTPYHGHNKYWKAVARYLGAVPRATAKLPPEEIPGVKWVIHYNGKILKTYRRKPNRSTIMNIKNLHIVGEPHTKGKLSIISKRAWEKTYA